MPSAYECVRRRQRIHRRQSGYADGRTPTAAVGVHIRRRQTSVRQRLPAVVCGGSMLHTHPLTMTWRLTDNIRLNQYICPYIIQGVSCFALRDNRLRPLIPFCTRTEIVAYCVSTYCEGEDNLLSNSIIGQTPSLKAVRRQNSTLIHSMLCLNSYPKTKRICEHIFHMSRQTENALLQQHASCMCVKRQLPPRHENCQFHMHEAPGEAQAESRGLINMCFSCVMERR